ncbi:hypothetical protein [Agrobacterium sp. CG674]
MVVLASGAKSAEIVDDSRAVLGDAITDKMMEATVGSFKDPTSVQFMKLSHPTLPSGDARKGVVCGMVNAKNGFGGYNGFTPFVYNASDQSFAIYNDRIEPHLRELHLMAFKFSGCGSKLGVPRV